MPGRLLFAAVFALGLALPAAAGGWSEIAVRESPRDAVATCLRSAGSDTLGLLGPLQGSTTNYDVLRLRGIQPRRVARIALPVIYECPEIASNGARTVLSVATGKGRLLAWIHERGSTRRVTVRDARRPSDGPADVAVGPDGSAVFAWTEGRRRPAGRVTRTRVRVRRLDATGVLGPARTVAPWRRAGGFVAQGYVVAAVDASGTATVAWTQPKPDRGRRVGGGQRAFSDLSDVGVGTLSPGGDWRPQRLSKEVQATGEPALAVASDGHAVLAHDGNDAVRVYDREAPTGGFARRATLTNRMWGAGRPAAAIRPGGGALVAWVEGGDFDGVPAVRAASRTAPGAFGAARVVRPGIRRSGVDSGGFFGLADGGGAVAPWDEENLRLRAALDAGGRWMLSWGEAVRSRFWDAPVAPIAAVGGLATERISRRRLGCACRGVNGLAPLVRSPAGLGLAFSDNATSLLGSRVRDVGTQEIASSDGRLHLVDPATRADPRGGAPRLTASASAQRLRYSEAVRVRTRCDRPCELRAVIPGRARFGRGFPIERGVRAVGTATLRRAGETTLAVRPAWDGRLAPLPPAPVRIVVRAWPARGGGTPSVSTVSPRLTLVRPRPVPPPIGVRAVRRGRRVVVSWRMRRPVRRVDFSVVLEPYSRRAVSHGNLVKWIDGRAGRRFRTAFRLRPGDRPRRATVSSNAQWPPHRSREVRVPIERRG